MTVHTYIPGRPYGPDVPSPRYIALHQHAEADARSAIDLIAMGHRDEALAPLRSAVRALEDATC